MNWGNYEYIIAIDNYGTIFNSVGQGPLNVLSHPSERSEPLSNKCIDVIKSFVQIPFSPHNYYPYVIQFLRTICDEVDAVSAELALVQPILQTRTKELEASKADVVRVTGVAVQHCEEVARLVSRMEVMEKELARLTLCEEELSRLKQIEAGHLRTIAFEQRLLQQQRVENTETAANATDPE